jgi:hypothetical protein
MWVTPAFVAGLALLGVGATLLFVTDLGLGIILVLLSAILLALATQKSFRKR